MKGIKPFRLSLLTRPFQYGREHRLGIATLAFFPLSNPGEILTDMELWPFAAEALGADGVLDYGIPKSRAEILVTGKAYPPGGRPATTCPVRIQIGTVDKSLYVIGDRFWRGGVPTDPLPFTEMDVSWANAFGGEGYLKNPGGKGLTQVPLKSGELVHPLPNIESPNEMVTAPTQKPDPVGFGPLGFGWPQRSSKLGTYDKQWLDTCFPGFAEDIDWSVWNLAARDQHLQTNLRGDEELVMHHMHPEQSRLESHLPGILSRCFVTQAGPSGDVFLEVPLNLSTVWLFPDADRGVVIFHGATPIAEDDGADIRHILVAAERLGEPREAEHYRSRLAFRLDPENVVDTMSDDDLMPEGMTGLSAETERAAELLTGAGIAQEKRKKWAQAQVDGARALAEEHGLDADEHGPSPLEFEAPPKNLSELGDFLKKKRIEAEEAKASAEKDKAESMARIEKLLEEAGLDPQMIHDEINTVPGGPPEFSADERRSYFRKLADEAAQLGHPQDEFEWYATDEKIFALWQEQEQRVREGYRLGAHLQGPAAPMDPVDIAVLRDDLEARVAAGESFAGRDLTGADLRELDLRGVDFRDAFLEAVDFESADLRGGKFDRAVIAHANLRSAQLEGACFEGANLGKACLHGAIAPRVDLRQATLWASDFTDADLSEAVLEGAICFETVLQGANLSRANAAGVTFFRARLARTTFTGASVANCMFIEVDVSGVDFGGACLDEAVFLKSSGPGATFVNAHMKNFRLVEKCNFEGCDFRGAKLDGSNLRATRLKKSDFSGAHLNGADLSESDVSEGKFYRSVARDSSWVKTRARGAMMVSIDLMNALVQKADLRGVDLRGANLYGADFALIQADEDTDVTDAYQVRVRSLPRRES